MDLDFNFFIHSLMLGLGLAMDAFSVSLANGLNEPCMKKKKTFIIASVFAFFQTIMPLIGWICVSTIAQHFKVFEKAIPWIALVLLCYIGGKMLYESLRSKSSCADSKAVCFAGLLIQGVATSIDALSVGFTISDYNLPEALLACLLIGAVTLLVCLAGVFIGKKAGTKLAGKASILGGAILIIIGLEIFITSWF